MIDDDPLMQEMIRRMLSKSNRAKNEDGSDSSRMPSFEVDTFDCSSPEKMDTEKVFNVSLNKIGSEDFTTFKVVIRHKRTASHAARGPLPFIPFTLFELRYASEKKSLQHFLRKSYFLF